LRRYPARQLGLPSGSALAPSPPPILSKRWLVLPLLSLPESPL
jgi:hypothetical protein